jgi:hypothetical protein
MPNHCENDLYIQGEQADTDALLLHIGMLKPKPEFDFNTLVPYPDPFKTMDDEAEAFGWAKRPSASDPERAFKLAELKKIEQAYVAKWGTTNDGFNSGGIEWRHDNWGTKWNAYDVARRDYDGRICVTFQTAWAPPTPIIVALAKRFPTVTISLEYFERGMEVAGGFTCESEDDHWQDEPWKPGVMSSQWELKGYRGKRGG